MHGFCGFCIKTLDKGRLRSRCRRSGGAGIGQKLLGGRGGMAEKAENWVGGGGGLSL
jgi:hypothetical protein